MSVPPDPLDDLLSFPVAENPALRDRLRAATLRVVRRRWYVRRLTWAGAVAACVAVAGATWYGLRPAPPPLVVDGGGTAMARVDRPPDRGAEPPPDTTAEPTPAEREWAAFDSAPAERPARYLAAGDQYVAEAQDYAAALRCYRQALETGGPAATEIDPADNWLVMALKLDQRKEH